MITRETTFRESDHPGIVFPGNVLSGGKWPSGKRLSGKKTIRESNHPGNDRIPTWATDAHQVTGKHWSAAASINPSICDAGCCQWTTTDLIFRHLFILLACQLKIINVVLQPRHNNYLNIIWSSNNQSLIEYWNSCNTELTYVCYFFTALIFNHN